MKKLLLILAFFVSYGVSAQPTIHPLASGTNFRIAEITCTNALTLHAMTAFGSYLKSTNAGLNWSINSVSSSTTEALQFVTPSIAYGAGTNGVVVKTTDGGISWNAINVPGAGNLLGVYFLNAQTGFVTGISSTVKKTTDGGISWISQTGPTSNGHYYDIVFEENGNNGSIAVGGSSSAHFITTSNGGLNWTTAAIRGNTRTISLRSLDFSTNRKYAVGCEQINGNFQPVIFVSTDGGATWSTELEELSPSKGILYDIKVSPVNPNMAVAVGQYDNDPVNGQKPLIMTTTNGGVTWTEQSYNVPETGLSSVCATATDFFAVGDKGIMLQIPNFTTSVQTISTEMPKEYTLSQNYPNPFNPSTKIRFSLTKKEAVTLRVYDMLGKEVAQLVNGDLNIGTYEYTFDAKGLSSGIYNYILESKDFRDIKQMVLVK